MHLSETACDEASMALTSGLTTGGMSSDRQCRGILAQDFVQAFCKCSDKGYRQGQLHVEKAFNGFTGNLHNVHS